MLIQELHDTLNVIQGGTDMVQNGLFLLGHPFVPSIFEAIGSRCPGSE
jgi:hypothetical protein